MDNKNKDWNSLTDDQKAFILKRMRDAKAKEDGAIVELSDDELDQIAGGWNWEDYPDGAPASWGMFSQNYDDLY